MKFPIFKNIKGETIAETIIAVSILAIGITLSSTLMGNSLRNMNVSKDRVIAVNIAREGVEAVRNIRDTNWLKFSGKRRLCWNHLPSDLDPVDCSEACDGFELIEPGNYIVYKAVDTGVCDVVQRWKLHEIIADDYDETIIYKVDIDTEVDTDGDGDYENDHDMYNHIDAENLANSDALGKDYAVRTNFSRTITIEYMENDGSLLSSGSVTDEYNRMVVTSTVTWIKGKAEHRVELKTHLTDYLGRDNLDS